MAFELIVRRLPAGRKGLPATISLSGRTEGRPALNIAMTKDFVQAAAFAAEGISGIINVTAMVGTGDDAGKIRLKADADGINIGRISAKSGALLLNLGFVEALGPDFRKKAYTTARVVSPGLVEIDVPAFAGADDDDDANEETAPPSARSPTGRKQPAAVSEINGVTIDSTLDNESVSFKGKSIEVTTRQAKFTFLLARPRPEPVAETFLVKQLWENSPRDAAQQLRVIAADLQKALSTIGLNLLPVRGVGYQLKDL